MAEQKIELRKIRDFGANLGDTFEFIRQNFQPMIKCFFAIAGIFILLQAVSNGVVESQLLSGFTRSARIGSSSIFDAERMMVGRYLTFPFLFFMILTWLAYIAMQVCIGAYMKYYEQNDKQRPGIEEVWDIFKAYYLKVLIYSIPVYILVIIGCLFCLAPGIYLGVVFVPFAWVIMMEDASLGDGIQRCFELIKQNFWMSLGIYLVTYLIYSFASGIIGVIIGGVSGLLAYFTTKDLSSTVGIATSILRIFGFIFYIIFLVSSLLNYYSLVEKRDAVGMMQRVDQMGTQRDGSEGYEEQF